MADIARDVQDQLEAVQPYSMHVCAPCYRPLTDATNHLTDAVTTGLVEVSGAYKEETRVDKASTRAQFTGQSTLGTGNAEVQRG